MSDRSASIAVPPSSHSSSFSGGKVRRGNGSNPFPPGSSLRLVRRPSLPAVQSARRMRATKRGSTIRPLLLLPIDSSSSSLCIRGLMPPPPRLRISPPVRLDDVRRDEDNRRPLLPCRDAHRRNSLPQLPPAICSELPSWPARRVGSYAHRFLPLPDSDHAPRKEQFLRGLGRVPAKLPENN